MEQPNRLDVLNAASSADETACTEHFKGFVNSFVQKHRRERWLYLLLNRPKQIYSNSHKLHSHLEWSRCLQLDNTNQLNQKSEGVYYGFSDEPIILTVADAFLVGTDNDAIFSLVAGKLAIYFFHEGEIILCKLQS